MRQTLFLWLFIAIFISGGGYSKAQCPPITNGYFQLSTQQEVNNFPVNYPNCTAIDGRFIIKGADITDLTPLQQITSVKGLIVQYITGTNLQGLQNITLMDGVLSLRNNPNLTDLSALSQLTTTKGLDLDQNNSLSSLQGLHNIATVNGELAVIGNGNLLSLQGLNALTTITDRLYLRNLVMTDLQGLQSLKSVGSLWIQYNNNLLNIDGLSSIQQLTGSTFYPGLTFTLNPKLNSIAGLINLTTINNQKIQVFSNAALPTLSGLDNIDFNSITGLTLKSSTNLSICNVPSICSYLAAGKTATISGNSVGCNSVEQVQQFCQGFGNCPQGDVTLSTQADVALFVAQYPNCTTIDGTLTIGNDTGSDISNISGLQNLSQITGGIIIKNTSLSNLTGLNAITQIGGDLTIENNSQLVDTNALTALVNIGSKQLIIRNNGALTSLTGLGNINPSSISNLILESSQNLSTCNVPSICNYISKFGNSYTISGNATGCSNVQEVMAACQDILPVCPEGDVQFLSQQELNHFLVQYQNCTMINGLVKVGSIYEETDIDNIQPLNKITYIAGELETSGLVITKTKLQNLNGLQNLTGISGQLTVNFNSDIQSLYGLQNVNEIGQLNVSNNPQLTSLNGMQGLVNASMITIATNNQLTNLSGLNNVTNSKNIEIYDNPALISLEGLNNLESVFGDIRIDGNPVLNDLTALGKLKSVYALGTFEQGTGFGGRLRFNGNNGLTNLNGLNNLETLAWLEILGNNSLTDITALSKLNAVKVNLVIGANHSLTSLEGLHNVKTVGYLSSGGNVGDLQINDNPLSNLNGLRQLELVYGSVEFTKTDNLSGIDKLKNIGSTLMIRFCKDLQNLQGLNNLERTGYFSAWPEGMLVYENNKLENVNALTKLVSLQKNSIGYMSFVNNPLLTSLDGLKNIIPATLTYFLYLRDNPLLSYCSVPAICNYVANPDNEMQIYNNAGGCNSIDEITAMCTLSVEQTETKPEITLYPVPVAEVLNITANKGAKLQEVKIYDFSGKLVYSASTNLSRIDITHLKRGVYVVTIQTSKGVHQQKIIKK